MVRKSTAEKKIVEKLTVDKANQVTSCRRVALPADDEGHRQFSVDVVWETDDASVLHGRVCHQVLLNVGGQYLP